MIVMIMNAIFLVSNVTKSAAIIAVQIAISIFTIIAYELYKTALYRLNFKSANNPANGAITMMKVQTALSGINVNDIDLKFICKYASML